MLNKHANLENMAYLALKMKIYNDFTYVYYVCRLLRFKFRINFQVQAVYLGCF